MTEEDINSLNSAVSEWTAGTFGGVKSRYLQLINSPKRSGDGFESLRAVMGKKFGEVDSIAFKFNRYLVFVHKGVGRSRPIGSDKVTPKPWLQPELDIRVPQLADIVAAIKTDAVVRAIDIK